MEGNTDVLTPVRVFQSWGQALEADPRSWSRFAARYKWDVRGPDGGAWVIDCGTRPRIELADGPNADFEIGLSSADFLELVQGKLNPQVALVNRRLQVRGKMKYVLRFNLLLDALLDLER